ncbi:DUF4957 domain-containing protein [Haliscomenobacter hydrossis]|uniref:DUF4957 domain-containing protein n=1 Tax=Haliscomenobacter hydrossis (strain ATCC 27775 / DSM 1100 / LMG 10767 / O) TaxID=760192 RepID=F4KQT7_HALH1|nr:DUF5123 domain-containing protein [Haliscomenobacter hydrossis]AEE52222.1 hypothetical protein Halhy_4378 [Haliscomenobacter hydrossis DSM 1100]
MKNIAKYAIFPIAFCAALVFLFSSCEKEEIVYEETRLFRPALNTALSAKLNTIIIDMAKMKEAVSYTFEISQDSFKTAPLYTFTIDTTYLIVDKGLVGEELDYNSSYQVRVTAIAADPQFNSRPALLGSVRTEPLPSIQLAPRAYDVTDVLARVRWNPFGLPVDQVKVFSTTDKKLRTPLGSYTVSSAQNTAGEVIIDKLTPATSYLVAIYSAGGLRGFVEYKTLEKGVYPGDPNVIDLTTSEDPGALQTAMASVAEGSIVLLKRGVRYNFPAANLSTSITIKGEYGLTEGRAQIFSTGDWRIATGVTIDHVVFDDIDIIGSDPGAVYVFNINNSGTPTIITNLVFKNCTITSLRGIARLRSDSYIKNFTITNSIVYNIGSYGVFTTDTDGATKAAVDHIKLLNSTFYQLSFIATSRTNSQSFLIDGCTFSEFTEAGQRTFRYRGGTDRNNIIGGLTISNSVWGTGWDKAASGSKTVTFKEGLVSTNVSVLNTWATSDFAAAAGSELPGFPALTYSGTATKLWTDPTKGNFSIADAGFAGKTSSGDPRWRVKL